MCWSASSFCKEIKDSLAEGEKYVHPWLWKFHCQDPQAEDRQEHQKNVAIEIPEQSIPAFKPAKVFMGKVKNAKPQAEE